MFRNRYSVQASINEMHLMHDDESIIRFQYNFTSTGFVIRVTRCFCGHTAPLGDTIGTYNNNDQQLMHHGNNIV